MTRIRSVLFVCLTLSSLLNAYWPGSGFLASDCARWHPAIEFLGRDGSYRHGGGAILWSPVGQDECRILFGQALGGLFWENYTGTIGGGYRWGWKEYTLGLNAFLDVARSTADRTYFQGGLGGEIFADCAVGRVNFYFPGHNASDIRREVTEDANQICTRIEKEEALWGFDLELGYGVQLFCGQLWGYAGYYRFEPNNGSAENGPRIRVNYTFDEFAGFCPLELTVGGEWENNSQRGSKVSGVISLRVPLFQGCNEGRGSDCCCSQWRQTGDRVFRNNSVWLRRSSREVCVPVVTPEAQ